VWGRVYSGGETLKTTNTKSTYGDRIGCGIKKNPETDDGKLLVYFNKNGAMVIYDDELWHFMKARYRIDCMKKVFWKISLVAIRAILAAFFGRNNFAKNRFRLLWPFSAFLI